MLEATLEHAIETMRDHGVQYLPVMEAGRPVGLVYDRDLLMAERLMAARWQTETVAAVMSSIPYCVSPETPVSEVAQHLAVRRLEAAIVMVGMRIVGLFSIGDALTLLSRLTGHAREQEGMTPEGLPNIGLG